ncbi:hypothetical protein GCM10007086_31410 [Photobacterium aphoticum]|nr:hypothetical protein GCM10007086_31410 [Photobacterium aphoticum]
MTYFTQTLNEACMNNTNTGEEMDKREDNQLTQTETTILRVISKRYAFVWLSTRL